MLHGVWSRPVFWIGLHFMGVFLTVGIYRLPVVKEKVLRAPRGAQRGFALVFYLLPPFILPLLPQPRLSWPLLARIGSGLVLLTTMAILRVTAQKELGAFPVLRQRSTLVTAGIYSWVRHPMYLSNILLGVGWTLIFPGLYGLLCIPIWTLCYVILTFFEEQGLKEEYREKYQEYKEKVRYRLVPYIF